MIGINTWIWEENRYNVCRDDEGGSGCHGKWGMKDIENDWNMVWEKFQGWVPMIRLCSLSHLLVKMN